MMASCAAAAAIPSVCSRAPWRRPSLLCRRRHRVARGEGLCCRAGTTYRVTLQTPDGEASVRVPDDVFVLDAAEDGGVRLPYSCRSGACSSCAALLKEGAVDQSDQTFLEEDRVRQGFILTCVAYPLSDLVMETHQERGLY